MMQSLAQQSCSGFGRTLISPRPPLSPRFPVRHRQYATFAASNEVSSTAPTSQASKGAVQVPPIREQLIRGASMQVVGYGSAPPPEQNALPIWAQELLPTPVPTQRRIFCNRALNMKAIKGIGFDMDYTLAQYKPESFEALAHSQTIDKLVKNFKYPEILRSFTFSWDYMMKGLIIDKVRGNVLKVDRHKYVKLAYHGFLPLSAEERKRTYNSNYQDQDFDGPEFSLVDTLFSLAEAYLYSQLVELKDSPEGVELNGKSYMQLYKDLRTAVDMCHRDGSLKRAVAANPEEYIHHDPLLKDVLSTLRAGGRHIFLATNSLWDYTNVVMNYLLEGKTGTSKTTEWLKHFDVVMVGCAKPSFFNHHGQLFSVDSKTGLLSNTDNGAPILPVDDVDHSSELDNPSSSNSANNPSSLPGPGEEAKVFQGGCYRDLHRMLGVTCGEQILYVGDHIYGDIVKSKKAIGWRTMLVVPELELELKLQESTKHIEAELRLLRLQRESLEDQVQRYQWALSHASPASPLAHALSSSPSSAASNGNHHPSTHSSSNHQLPNLDHHQHPSSPSSENISSTELDLEQGFRQGRADRSGQSEDTVGMSGTEGVSGQQGGGLSMTGTGNGSTAHEMGSSEQQQGKQDAVARFKNEQMLLELLTRYQALKLKHGQLLQEHHQVYHSVWGQILKTGYQNSRFAHQIERYACLYTSHVSNLAYYSPEKRWQGRLDFMAHEDVCW